MSNINHVKAYIIGLLVGGGKIDKDVFVIDLPFKKWGMEPNRMSIIATDILTANKIKAGYLTNCKMAGATKDTCRPSIQLHPNMTLLLFAS